MRQIKNARHAKILPSRTERLSGLPSGFFLVRNVLPEDLRKGMIRNRNDGEREKE